MSLRGGARTRDALFIVEPDAAIAQFLALVCAEEGYAAAWAASPAAALALLVARGPVAFRVVLSYDFARGTVAPYAWLDHLRTRTDAPIVICTRDPAVTYADHRARGYAGVLEEPCDLDDVLDAVVPPCAMASGAHLLRGSRRARGGAMRGTVPGRPAARPCAVEGPASAVPATDTTLLYCAVSHRPAPT